MKCSSCFLDSLVDDTVEMMVPFPSESELSRKATTLGVGTLDIAEVLQKILTLVGSCKNSLEYVYPILSGLPHRMSAIMTAFLI